MTKKTHIIFENSQQLEFSIIIKSHKVIFKLHWRLSFCSINIKSINTKTLYILFVNITSKQALYIKQLNNKNKTKKKSLSTYLIKLMT